jgi:hypothetical protein
LTSLIPHSLFTFAIYGIHGPFWMTTSEYQTVEGGQRLFICLPDADEELVSQAMMDFLSPASTPLSTPSVSPSKRTSPPTSDVDSDKEASPPKRPRISSSITIDLTETHGKSSGAAKVSYDTSARFTKNKAFPGQYTVADMVKLIQTIQMMAIERKEESRPSVLRGLAEELLVCLLSLCESYIINSF